MKAKKTVAAKSVGRHIRFAADLDQWLANEAADKGFRSIAELVNQIVREAKAKAAEGNG